MLLIQFIGSLGSEIFSFYILQSHFYLSMLFAAASPVAQVFMYSFLGDQLGQQVCVIKINIFYFFELVVTSDECAVFRRICYRTKSIAPIGMK